MPSAIDFIRSIFKGAPSTPPIDVAVSVLRVSRQLFGDGSRIDVAQRVCEALVEELSPLELAWIWFGDPDTERVRPVAYAGRAAAYAATLDIQASVITRLGPVFRTIRGETVHAYAISTTSLHAPWRSLAERYGVRSVNVLPLDHGQASERGLLALYASDATFFSTRNQELFLEFGRLLGSVMFEVRRAAALAEAAERDPLTGILNRRGLLAAVDRCNEHIPWTLALIDVDHFKSVNTNLGFVAADRLLVDIARGLQTTVGSTGLVARIGGDEFALLLPGPVIPDGQRLAERVLANMPKNPVDGSRMTCSIGLTPFDRAIDLEHLIARADAALRAAKGAGRNGFRITLT
jgi:diguanylate cyclase (GGDEF)-like protein